MTAPLAILGLAYRTAGIEYCGMKELFRRLRPSPPTPCWIEAATLPERLSADGAPMVLDVRGPNEFGGPLGHISGAINLPLDELTVHLTELAREGRSIVGVCKTDRRSSVAARQLNEAGISSVFVLRGGMEQWHALGLPVS